MQLLRRILRPARKITGPTIRRALVTGLSLASPLLHACAERTHACDIDYPRMPDVVCGDSYVHRHQSCECDGRIEKVTQPSAAGSMGIGMGCSVVETVCHGDVKSTSITPARAMNTRSEQDAGAER